VEAATVLRVTGPPYRYRSHDEDSSRWLGFRFRPGDIVISTRRRSGTTWLQMICALLIFQRPELPAPLWHLSPWLDHTIAPLAHVHGRLAQQPHRRFIKTHTPLDGIPQVPGVTFIVTARHPLDLFVSLRHQMDNIDHVRPEHRAAVPPRPTEPIRDSLLTWIGSPVSDYPETLPGVLHHLTGAWIRRAEPPVVLVHYDDLRADLEGQMRAIAWRLGIAVPEEVWPALVRAASFDRMRERSSSLVPSAHGVISDTRAFFHRGTSGAGRELLTPEELAGYHARAARLAPPDLLEWLHSPPGLAPERRQPAAGQG